jgi:hypothetical protein
MKNVLWLIGSAVLYKKITTLVTEALDASLLLEPDKLKFGAFDTHRAAEWFSNMGMQNLLGKFMAVVA